jgi:hypothetical protein
MREVQFQRAFFGRYLDAASMLTWNKPRLADFGSICIQNSNVPLRIGRWRTFAAGK